MSDAAPLAGTTGRADPRRLILRSFLSPGDIVMLTAAVRDLHRTHPGRFATAVRTSCPELWTANPHLTSLDDADPDAEVIDCEYPLVHASNRVPFHFIHGYRMFLEQKLNVRIAPTEFRGDIYLDPEEKRWMSQVEEIAGLGTRFWIVVAGGKYDYTAKWWSAARFQEVVDALVGRVLFVQVGSRHHYHPTLARVLDLRGRTSLRQLVRLMYHADGVLCGVTLHMHLAAAVETPPDRPRSRACVVVAGAREPPHWEAYPQHQFLHTSGTLACCETGGCWKARTVAIGDGSRLDRPENLCIDVVRGLPRCMNMITVSDVVRRIEWCLADGRRKSHDAA